MRYIPVITILALAAATASCYKTAGDKTTSTVDTVGADTIAIPNGCTNLVFNDEFDTDGMPDSTKWSYEQGYLRNHELQYYTVGRKDNARVENGTLRLTAIADSAVIDGEMRPVSSASLITRGKHDWTYGYVEVRAKLPKGLGTWPAIWMMPTDRSYGKWPACGEIDIMENVGYMPDKIHFSAHSETYNHVINTQKTHVIDVPGVQDGFHTYALRWTPDSLTWYMDGEEQYTVTREEDATYRQWPFDKPFYLILNFAFGGDWGGNQGVDMSALPQEFEIDYVRVFK